MSQQFMPYSPISQSHLLQEKALSTFEQALNRIKILIPHQYASKVKQPFDTLQSTVSQIELAIKAMVLDREKETKTQNTDKSEEFVYSKMQERENEHKKMQVKLLQKIKILDVKLKQKESEVEQIKGILQEKQMEIESLMNINQKKFKRIKDLQRQSLELEEKLFQQQERNDRLNQELSDLYSGKNEEFGTQTEDDENMSHKSSLPQNKEKSYIQSIERLTLELTEAYEKINGIKKGEEKERKKKKSKSFYLNSFFK